MNKSIHKHIPFFILVIALMSIIFQSLYAFMRGQENNVLIPFLINFPISLFVVFVDVLIIQAVSKKLNHSSIYLQILLDLILTSVFVAIINIGVNSLFILIDSDSEIVHDYWGSLAIAILANSIIVLIIEIFFYSQKQLEAEKRAIAAEKEKIQFMYDTLRSQVNPHFLFNSLNTLSSLIYEDRDRASAFTKKLSGLYRYALSLNRNESVPLSKEMSFIESYLYLMQIRFGTALRIKVMIADKYKDEKLIPMSIQLLVENAVKHNIITKTQPLTISILIDENGVLVSNSVQPKDVQDKTGFGLQSLKEQYALHSKSIEIIEVGGTFTVRIPFL